MEDDGLILRHQYNEIPPRVEYELTELSKRLIIALQPLNEWGKEAQAARNNS
jgi:DNA-binding HxlR family transcriptional regulator